MVQHHKIINLDLNRRASTPDFSVTLPQLVRSAQRTAKHHLRSLLPAFFSSVDDCLFELADKAESNQQQTLYFDAMRNVRLQKNSMQKHYFDTLERAFKAPLDQPTQNHSTSLEHAGLIEDEQLEESLAISNMVSNAENRYRESLFNLTARFDFLIDETLITKDNNPLRPEILFSAFTPSVQQIESDIKVRLVVYKLFDKFVAQKIGPIYDIINADLIAAGVLPRIKSTIRKSDDCRINTSTEINQTTPAAENSDIIDPSNISINGASQPVGFFASMQQLLSQQRAISDAIDDSATIAASQNHPQTTTMHVNSHETDASTVYVPGDMLIALSTLQTSSAVSSIQQNQSSAASVKLSVTEAINHLYTGEKKAQINQADTDAIDIVSMLFDFILDDPSLQDQIKAQIIRLQIPLLKVAIIDKEFFARKSHPARQLLNELAYAGSGLEEINEQENAIYKMILYVVDSVQVEFDENIDIFTTLLSEFCSFMEKERENNKLAAERLDKAKDLVTHEIQRRVTNNRIPPLVSIILIEAWKDVLTRLYLRDGEDSTAWNTALQVADDLIWSVQPKLVVSERQRLIKIIPRLLNGLRDGLTLIQFDADASSQIFSGLETLHLTSLRGGIESTPHIREEASLNLDEEDFGIDISTLAEDNQQTPSPVAHDPIMEEIILASTQSINWESERDNDPLLSSQYANDIKEMALGTWVEFVNPETKQCKRGKLAWKCDFTGEYTFIDRKYTVIADMNHRQLIAEFELGQASFVEDIPLFDRALDSVISGIKNALAGQNIPDDTMKTTH